MAKVSVSNSVSFRKKPKMRRKGVHSKTKASKSKNGTNYQKIYRGQGK